MNCATRAEGRILRPHRRGRRSDALPRRRSAKRRRRRDDLGPAGRGPRP